jgi:hypothetical protein
MSLNKRIVSSLLLVVLGFCALAQPGLASGSNKAGIKKKTQTNNTSYFHKRRLVHKKAPIPKDPKPTKADLKKARQQKVVGAVYVKELKGWLTKKKPAKKKTSIKKKTASK